LERLNETGDVNTTVLQARNAVPDVDDTLGKL